MRILICGGRDLDEKLVAYWLAMNMPSLLAERSYDFSPLKQHYIIHGGASGADAGARIWANLNNYNVIVYPADWQKHGRAAGPIRNAQMLVEGKPDVVIALPGGRGTADMVRQAKAAGVPVVEVERI